MATVFFLLHPKPIQTKLKTTREKIGALDLPGTSVFIPAIVCLLLALEVTTTLSSLSSFANGFSVGWFHLRLEQLACSSLSCPCRCSPCRLRRYPDLEGRQGHRSSSSHYPKDCRGWHIICLLLRWCYDGYCLLPPCLVPSHPGRRCR